MSKRTGRDISVGMAKESERGTPESAMAYWLPHRALEFEDKAVIIIDDQAYGVIEDSVAGKVVSKWAEGSITGLVRDRAIGLLLYNALGAEGTPVSTPEDDVYDHVFTVYNSHQHPSLTVAIEDPDGDKAYALCMVNTLEITAELNEFVVFSADLISKKGASTSATPAYIAENNFIPSEMSIKFATGTPQIAAATATKVKSAAITIEKELEKDDVLGSVDPDDILNKTVRVGMVIEKTYDDATFKDYYTSATPKAIELKITSGTLIGTSSYPTLTIVLNQAYITDYSVAKGLDDIVTETLTLKATFKIADSEMIQVDLRNEVSAYQ